MILFQQKPKPITRELIPKNQTLSLIENLLGIPIRIEIVIQGIARRMCPSCEFKFWVAFYLTNGGFYLAPSVDRKYPVICDNGWQGVLLADALGLAASMLAYSHMSFTGRLDFDQCCDDQYFHLKEFVAFHDEAATIRKAVA
jgi:hypothetical protein